MSPMKDCNLVPRSIVGEADTRDLGTKLKEDKTVVLQCYLCYMYHIDILQNSLRAEGLTMILSQNNSWRCFNLEPWLS